MLPHCWPLFGSEEAFLQEVAHEVVRVASGRSSETVILVGVPLESTKNTSQAWSGVPSAQPPPHPPTPI